MASAVPRIEVREIRPQDAEGVGRLIAGLDEESAHRRWFTGAVDRGRAAQWAAHPERFAAIGLVALAGEEVVGHGVLVPVPVPGGSGELAFEVAAPWRRHGIAGLLLEGLLAAAAARGLHEVYAEVLPENRDMLAVLREHGEHTERRSGGDVILTLPVDNPVRSA